MGFFSIKVTCDVCGEKCGLNRYLLKDNGWCCSNCFKKARLNLSRGTTTISSEEIKNLIARKESFIEKRDDTNSYQPSALPTNPAVNKQVSIPKNVCYECDSLRIEADKLIAYKNGVVCSIWYYSSYQSVEFIPADSNSNFAQIVFLENNVYDKKKEQKDIKKKYKIAFCCGILQLAKTNSFTSPIFDDIHSAFMLFHQQIKENNKKHLEFQATRNIGDHLNIDDTNRKVELINKKVNQILNFEDIIDFQVLKNQTSVSSSDWSNVLLGGMLFGSTGAIVGSLVSRTTRESLDRLSLIINTKYNTFCIDFISDQHVSDSVLTPFVSTQLSEVCTAVEYIIKSSNTVTPVKSSSVQSNDLRELKSLLDDGIITKEEFDAKKKQLLGL